MVWALFPAVSLPLFDGGRNRANLQRAEAAYRENVARYRERLLVAFREVEDQLSTLRLLAQQRAAQERAMDGAVRASRLVETRHRAGLAMMLDVIDVERTRLSLARADAQLRGQQLGATVGLVRALGGGWMPGGLAGVPPPPGS